MDAELSTLDPELSKKVGHRLHEAVDRFEGALADAEMQMLKTTGQAVHTVNNTKANAKSKAAASMSRVDNYLNEKPAQAAGLAFAAGVLTALWLKRG